MKPLLPESTPTPHRVTPAVSPRMEPSGVGGIQIYTVTEGAVSDEPVKTIEGTADANDQVGKSCMLSKDGSRIVCGVPGTTETTGPGKVQVYERGADDTVWTQLGTDITSNTQWAAVDSATNPKFGSKVAISGNGQVIVASDAAMGITEVYQYLTDTWVSIGKIQSAADVATNNVAINNDGTHVAVSCVEVVIPATDDIEATTATQPAIYTLVKGCTDSTADNYVQTAIINDGSCSTASPDDDPPEEETSWWSKNWWWVIGIIVVLLLIGFVFYDSD